MAHLKVRFPAFGFDSNSEDEMSEDNFGCTPAIATPDMPDTILLSLQHNPKKALESAHVLESSVTLENRSDESTCRSEDYAASPGLEVPDRLPQISLRPILASSTSEHDEAPSSPCLEVPDRLPVVELKNSSTRNSSDETSGMRQVQETMKPDFRSQEMHGSGNLEGADNNEDHNNDVSNEDDLEHQGYIEPTYFENHDDYYPVVEPTYNEQNDDWDDDEPAAQSPKMRDLLSNARSEQQARTARAPLSVKNLNVDEAISTKKRKSMLDPISTKAVSSNESKFSSQSKSAGVAPRFPSGSTLPRQSTIKKSSKNVSKPGRQMTMLTFVAKPKNASIHDSESERWLPRLK